MPRILIVDDREQNVRVLESMLAPQGYEVILAYGGMEALERVAEERPDLILLDVLMPDMDGFTVTRALRAAPGGQALPILMVTALHEVQDKVRGFEAGADDFLSKPFNSIELLARVRSLLRIKRLHDELEEKNALLENVLKRYVSEEIAHEILNDPGQNMRLGGQSCEVSVLFADIRGFTRFSEQYNATKITEVLNFVFHYLTAIVFEYRGTLDKYLGDAIMVFYGAPIPLPNNAAQAVRTAWAMQSRFTELQQENAIVRELGLGVGICTGEAVVGNIGSERVMDYTVIGNTPNTAKRLQEQALAGQILVDERTVQAVDGLMRTRQIQLPNADHGSQPIRAYEVVELGIT